MEESIKRLGFIGAGKVGSAFALLLQKAGYEVVGIASRTPSSAQRLAARLNSPVLTAVQVAENAQALFLTTTDDALAEVVADLTRDKGFHPGQIVLHTSGALTSKVLDSAAARGAITLSLHPLQSFASVDEAVAILPGSYFSVEGDTRGFSFAREIVEKLGGRCFYLDSEAKVLYHAAACVASNYLVGIVACSLDLLAAAKVPEEVRLISLLPLIEGTLNNVRKMGIPQALTGPLARGDLGTVRHHLAALKDLPEQLAVYQSLGLYTVDVARAKGTISAEQASALRSLLEKRLEKDFVSQSTP